MWKIHRIVFKQLHDFIQCLMRLTWYFCFSLFSFAFFSYVAISFVFGEFYNWNVIVYDFMKQLFIYLINYILFYFVLNTSCENATEKFIFHHKLFVQFCHEPHCHCNKWILFDRVIFLLQSNYCIFVNSKCNSSNVEKKNQKIFLRCLCSGAIHFAIDQNRVYVKATSKLCFSIWFLLNGISVLAFKENLFYFFCYFPTYYR